MLIPDWMEKWFLAATDFIFARLPAPMPAREVLQACRLITHRGEYDNRVVFENTLPAFETAVAAGVWGLECDLRWTKDLVPVIHHDPDLARLHGRPERISALTWAELRKTCPIVPSLEEVINRHGGKNHLMLEVKEEPYPDISYQNQVLEKLFSGLEPLRDYHLLSLTPGTFKKINFVPRNVFLPVAQMNLASLSRLALQEGYGGVNGHYLFTTDDLIQRHHDKGQAVGTGFVASLNCLFREINRGVDWIYSNQAARLQWMIQGVLSR